MKHLAGLDAYCSKITCFAEGDFAFPENADYYAAKLN